MEKSVASKIHWHIKNHPWSLPLLLWKNLKYRFSPRAIEARFDRALKVDTCRYEGASELASEQEIAGAAVDYDPSPAAIADFLIRQLTADFKSFTFVDFGAGKGRVLIIAAKFPFASVKGVEWSEFLCRTAQANIAKIRDQKWVSSPIEITFGDAAKYPIPKTPSVLYFFFRDLTTAAKIAGNIRNSYLESPRKIFVICYSVPEICRLFDDPIYLSRRVSGVPNRDPRYTRFEAMIFETR